MKSLMERVSKGRIHKIKIVVEYEGTPFDGHVEQAIAAAMGDVIAMALRDRHNGTGDSIYTLGLAQELDIKTD